MDPITLGFVAIVAGAAFLKRRSGAATEIQPDSEIDVLPRQGAKLPDFSAARKAACSAANKYVNESRKAGLPVPSDWEKLDCDAKIALVASIAAGGGTPIPVVIVAYVALKSGVGKKAYDTAVGAAKHAQDAFEANKKGATDFFKGKVSF